MNMNNCPPPVKLLSLLEAGHKEEVVVDIQRTTWRVCVLVSCGEGGREGA